jgi:hypothetical protein
MIRSSIRAPDDDDTLFLYMGFGQPPPARPPYIQAGRLTRYWGPTVELVITGRRRGRRDPRGHGRVATDIDLHVDVGEIKAGTINAALRDQGIVDGKPLVVLEHVAHAPVGRA